jgi:hypothetical protein
VDSDDLEFVQQAANALDIDDDEYVAWLDQLQSEEFLEDSTPGELLGEDEFYSLAGDWDDWLEPDTWYELTAEYEENN